MGLQDLQDIANFINELSPEGAVKLYDEIIEKRGLLSQMSLRSLLVKNPLLKVKGYRVFSLNN